MAENRGGYRKPSGGVRAKGVGKNSQRTDANQPIRVPNVQDSEDLSIGDRRKLEAAQSVAPIGRARAPQVQAPTQSPGGGPAPLPDYLATMPSSRPDEPITEGLPFGPGAGPEVLAPPPPNDDKEVVLQFLVDNFQDEAAFNMLNQIRRDKVAPKAPAPMFSEQIPVEPEAPTELDEPEPVAEYEDLATEEEVAVEGEEEELSVETPEAAASTEEAPV